MQGVVIAGTDTNVGKTILSALLMSALPEAVYWKPIQSGLQEESDSEIVARLSGAASERILPEAYRLSQPLSPHLSAALDNIEIEIKQLSIPGSGNFTIVELAGGLLVPLRHDVLQIEMLDRWQLPVLLATRSTLGTINHTLLSLEALRSRGIEILGAIVIGPVNPPNEEAIRHFGHIEILGRIPWLTCLDRESLRETFYTEFQGLQNILREHAAIDI
ncbi:MAG TPA: dethiobiotin synthase [Candidatus Kapabacteria bacterium]|jgi:dethiobiotin synthetase|nr:dethiobiotin synthase [Candidatus Kapabacteria bacterium]